MVNDTVWCWAAFRMVCTCVDQKAMRRLQDKCPSCRSATPLFYIISVCWSAVCCLGACACVRVCHPSLLPPVAPELQTI